MASQEDLNQFNRLRSQGVDVNAQLVKLPPKLPDEVKVRFPSLHKWEEEFHQWAQKNLAITVRGGQE